MRNNYFLLTLLAGSLLTTGCAKFFNSGAKGKRNLNVIEGQIVVKFQNSASEKDISAVTTQFEKSEVVDAKNKVYLLHDKELSGRETSTIDSIQVLPGVEFVEPNFRVSLAAEELNQNKTPQDPFYLKLWGLKNYGQDAPNGIEGTEGADIGTLAAWGTTTGSKEIKVAILDTGIDYTHPDLAENIWVNAKEKAGIPGQDDDGNGYVDDLHGWDAVSDNRSALYFGQVGDADPMDDQSHGTHVAGTIGAVGSNGVGVVGVNWQVSLVAVKFLDKNGSGSSVDEYRALQYILANDIDVVNGSYGGGEESKLIESALREGREKGILFVFASGNDSENCDTKPHFPANYKLDNIISVAATDARDQIADFSNFGQNSVHVAAPGVNILSTIPVSINKDFPYAVYSGTSMATPHVAGAAALLLAADKSLRKKPVQLKERLLKSAEFKPQLSSLVSTGSRLNVYRAIKSDTSGQPALAGQWQEQAYALETPRYPQKRVDNAWEVKVPGAKALRLHIRFAQIESAFDVAKIYDNEYRSVMNITGEMFDVWSPIILGDTARLKFSNSMVSIDGGTPFANFNSMGVQIDKIEVLK